MKIKKGVNQIGWIVPSLLGVLPRAKQLNHLYRQLRSQVSFLQLLPLCHLMSRPSHPLVVVT
jgi:hypothetical protein